MSGARATGRATGPTGAPRPLLDRPATPSSDVGTEPAEVPAPAVATAPRPGSRRWPAGLGRPSIVVPVVAGVLAIAIGAVLVRNSDAAGPGPGEAMVEVDGTVVVHRADGGLDTVTDRTRLEPGDRLRVRSGSAEMELADGVRFSAIAARQGRPASDVQMARVPTLRSGPLLVVAPAGTTLRSGAGEVRLGRSSAARVTRSTAVGVDVFEGRAVLASAGASREVPTLRNADIVAAGELSRTRPVSYRSADEWDRRYLGPALSLDRELASLVPGMQADGVDGLALAHRLRSRALRSISTEALDRLLARRTDGLDAAVGVSVVEDGEGSTYRQRWDRAFGFHDAGADWGLVAMDLGADPDAVIDALGRALQVSDGDGEPGTDGELASGVIDPRTGVPEPGTVVDGPVVGGTDNAGTTPDTPGAETPTTATPATPITVPGPTAPVVTTPPAVVPGVTLPPVTVPPGPVAPVVTTLSTVVGGLLGTGPVGGVTGPLVCGPGGLGPLTGSGGLLGGVTGSGGLLPVCP